MKKMLERLDMEKNRRVGQEADDGGRDIEERYEEGGDCDD